MNRETIFGQKYKGPVWALHGSTAMLQLNKYNGGVLAQFDDRSLGTWAYTWEWFPSEHFEITGVTRDKDGKLFAVDHFADVPFTATGRRCARARDTMTALRLWRNERQREMVPVVSAALASMANSFDDLGKSFKKAGETVEKSFAHVDYADIEARVLAHHIDQSGWHP